MFQDVPATACGLLPDSCCKLSIHNYWLGKFRNLACIVIIQVNVDAEYQFKAGIHHYNNSRHLARQFRFNGDCCDACDNPCDNRFVFCLREFEAPLRYTVLEERHCPLGRYSTDVIAPDNDNMEFVLGQNLYDEVPNPLVFSGSQWMVSKLILAVWPFYSVYTYCI